MEIDIDKLTEPQLIDLNHRIVQRLRLLAQLRSHMEMMQFKIGQRVYFQAEDGRPMSGMLTRYNKKTVTVIGDDGARWNISPVFLQPEPMAQAEAAEAENILHFRRE